MKGELRRRLRRGLTIEYAIVLMALVAAFVGLILITARLTTESAVQYRTYTERKAYLDEIGDGFLREPETFDAEEYAGNEFGFTVTVSEDRLTLTVTRTDSSSVALRVMVDAEGECLQYSYGP